MASHGSPRRFQVRTSHGKVLQNHLSPDQNLIDRSAGKIEQDTESELRDSRWSRLNDGGDQAAGFEKDRIAKLAEEREHIQKKTFTKWVNSHLNRVQQKIEDLYKDCRDGRALLVLLEILSGEKLPK
jgi:hypothetical protein